MTVKLAVIMDPIASINYKKDSTLAMLWEADRRGWEIFYIEQKDLFFRDGNAFANCKTLNVFRDPECWFQFKAQHCLPLDHFNVILMRKDPPFNAEYITTTYYLDHAEKNGVLVVNKPQSLRDANEKFFPTWFPQCCPPTLITRDMQMLRNFLTDQKDIVCKPLDGMGGESIFRVTYPDENASVIFETMTRKGQMTIVAQRYIPEIKQGDKRILLIDGKPIPYALARIPAPGELRGNLAAGGHAVAQPLSARDQWICQQVGERLKQMGLYFVGLDVIGDYLTEINVTSPTCIRELDEQCGLDINAELFNCIEGYLR